MGEEFILQPRGFWQNKESAIEYSNHLLCDAFCFFVFYYYLKKKQKKNRLTEVAGRRLELPVEAGLGGAEAARLLGVFAVERHAFPVGDHGVGNVEGPALQPRDDHAAPLGGDEAAGCDNGRQYESITGGRDG